MSKSLGNVIDPVDVIQGCELEKLHSKLLEGNLDEKEIAKAKSGQKKDFPKGIPQCGTDALRFALCAYSSGGRDINLDILRVEGYRKFCNKIWNATKFALLKLESSFVPPVAPKPTGDESLVEKWILHKLNIAATEVNNLLAERSFMLATTAIYNFWLYELCDVYIEAMKPMTDPSAPETVKRSAQNTLYLCLDYGLRLLHPMMPFVTEELWQRLPRRASGDPPSIMLASFPLSDPEFVYGKEEKEFEVVFSIIKTIRSMSVQYNLQNDIQVFAHSSDPTERAMLVTQIPTIAGMVKGCSSVSVVEGTSGVPGGCGSQVLSSSLVIYILVKGKVNLDEEIDKCDKKLALVTQSAEKLRKTLSDENVPETVREANKEKLETYDAEIAVLKQSREMFASLK